MFPPEPPRHSSGPAPHRVLAIGGAAAVTVMALAGSLGFGPGASAARESTPASSASPSVTAPTSPTVTAPTPSADPLAGTATSSAPPSTAASGGAPTTSWTPRSNGWMVYKSSPPEGTSAGGQTHTAKVPLPANSGSGRRVVYDISQQRVWLVDRHDAVKRTYLVSGSRHPHLLPPGSYTVFSRSLHAIAFNHKETMRYMVSFAYGRHYAIGFHDIPVSDASGRPVQSRRQLGTPLSAGCIRQWRPDAKALWRFALKHTTVVVTA